MASYLNLIGTTAWARQLMEKQVLQEAKRLKFLYQLCEENHWHILPTQPKETWKLTEADSRWILSVSNIPQIYLNPEEAISFLAWRAKNSISMQQEL